MEIQALLHHNTPYAQLLKSVPARKISPFQNAFIAAYVTVLHDAFTASGSVIVRG